VNLLVTAGNTLVPIDRVRCLTNVFTGRTGAAIALHACERGHAVVLLTSHPEAVAGLGPDPAVLGPRWTAVRYRTFEDLHQEMAERIGRGGLDAVVHCAAVSDYLSAGVYAPGPHTHFRPDDGCWVAAAGPPTLLDRRAGKVKSDEPELWLRLVRAPKLIDAIRRDWGFGGVLVKFKLEVGIGDEQLLAVAEASRTHSGADLLVANTLEGAGTWAYLGPLEGAYQKVGRRELAPRLLAAVEEVHAGKGG
jgi:phosphopantothenoylcysteine synthetase/decarboxylase